MTVLHPHTPLSTTLLRPFFGKPGYESQNQGICRSGSRKGFGRSAVPQLRFVDKIGPLVSFPLFRTYRTYAVGHLD